MLSATLILVLMTALAGFFVWSRRTFVYWQRRRVNFVQPMHLLGNLGDVLKNHLSFAWQLRDYYFTKRLSNQPVIGIYLFHQPALLLCDLQLIRSVLIDDCFNFSHRFAKCDVSSDQMGALNLYFARHHIWHDTRNKLAPFFTEGWLKQMFPLMIEIGSELQQYLAELIRMNGSIIQIQEVCDRYNTDMIASTVFGLRTSNLRSALRRQLLECSHDMFRTTRFKRAFDLCTIFLLPQFVKLLPAKLFASKHAEFLRRLVRNMLDDRERSVAMRSDFIEVLLTLKKEAEMIKDPRHFSQQPDYFVAQAGIFQMAGIQTCSNSLCFALYELALQPELQQRVRKEIMEILSETKLTYEKLQLLTYLNMVVNETLRKYPVVPILERQCTPVYGKQLVSMSTNGKCVAKRNMPVFISNLAIHRDTQLWPNPELFDPERFNPNRMPSNLNMTFLPFGAGPRQCIAASMAVLQIKIGLFYILQRCRLEVCEQTTATMEFDKSFTLLSPKEKIFLKLVEL